jgi:hypothetical protein
VNVTCVQLVVDTWQLSQLLSAGMWCADLPVTIPALIDTLPLWQETQAPDTWL